jgi:hypothetical protein
MTYLPPVTAHAVLRYLKRIEGFDLRPLVDRLGRDAGNWQLARAACAELGVDIVEIQRRICPEAIAGHVRAGVHRIRLEGMVLYCQGGLVTTITTETHASRIKVLSRRELKRGMQRGDRRR